MALQRGGTYAVFTHVDGTVCIWTGPGASEGWFVPLDAGGEGYTCTLEHPGDELQAEVRRLEAELEGVVRARNAAMRRTDEERRAKEGNIEALNRAIERAERAEARL